MTEKQGIPDRGHGAVDGVVREQAEANQITETDFAMRKHRSLWGDAWRRLISSTTARWGMAIVLFFVLAAILTHFFWEYNPKIDLDYALKLKSPNLRPTEEVPSIHPFGTDKLGIVVPPIGGLRTKPRSSNRPRLEMGPGKHAFRCPTVYRIRESFAILLVATEKPRGRGILAQTTRFGRYRDGDAIGPSEAHRGGPTGD